MLHIRLHNSNVQHILHVTQFGDCVNLCLSVKREEGGGLLIFGRGRGGGGLIKKRVGLQILDPQRLASLLGNLGITVRIYIHKPDVLT